MRVDLDEVERVTREMQIGRGPAQTLALVARIRELEKFINCTPDAALENDKLYRDDFPELFADSDGNALYMDEARSRILAKGIVTL